MFLSEYQNRPQGPVRRSLADYPTLREATGLVERALQGDFDAAEIVLTEEEKANSLAEAKRWVDEVQEFVRQKDRKIRSESEASKAIAWIGSGVYIFGLLMMIAAPLSLAIGLLGLLASLVGVVVMFISAGKADNARRMSIQLREEGRKLRRMRDKAKDQKLKDQIDDVLDKIDQNNDEILDATRGG
jgi:hypothetical protein